MYVVTGASGNTGSVVANTLLDNSKQVCVIGRNAEKLSPFTKRGAQAVIADVTDTAQMARAFEGAEAVYVMVPPNNAAPDFNAYSAQVRASLVSAVTDSRVSHVVCLSSIGADKPTGTGPVAGLHRLEESLGQISGLNVLFLRAGYFMENTLAQVQIIQQMKITAGPIRPDLKLPMIATRDIGAAAAQAMLALDFKGVEPRELLGERDLDYNEAASIIGNAIGMPTLPYMHLPDEQLRPALMQMGMSESFVGVLLEMAGALNSGYMRALEPRTARNTTPTSFESFVQEEFVPAYRGQAASA